MITPRFECSQTPERVLIKIYCPSVRAADVEIHVDDTLFSIHVSPYFLRLNFPHALVEDDQAAAKYDPGSGYLTVALTKATKGQEFADLELLSKLLAPRPSKAPHPPLIEVLGQENASADESDDELVARTNALSLEQEETLLAAEHDWQMHQEVPSADAPVSMTLTQTYGFLNLYSGYFKHVAYAENEVNELGADAESCTPRERRTKRWTHEGEKFDEEHYMADYADDEYIQELILWENPHVAASGPIEFTDQEKLALLNLPRKEYLADVNQTRNLYLTLVTILFAYAYDARTTQGDPTPESAWTICVLTPAFSALDPAPYRAPAHAHAARTPSPPDLVSCLAQSYRRVLSMPLYRSFALAETCRADVAALLLRGTRGVVRSLLLAKHVLDHHEVYYVYSKIWLEDFCVWVQTGASDDALCAVGTALANLQVPKGSLGSGWDLEELEAATREVQARQADSDDESDDEAETARQL
ncbi:SHQ1-domain-containing protein [Mycena pura]|uniref:SHQ1-domain-containing protein n=1 Tax=Mycena pura TaxID=153505 RepID=A0AAD6V3Y8_9AGAR|nr:SHQ1-domain-containing protein [Mycena pura]